MDKHRIKAAAYAILKQDGKVAFVRRQNTGFMDGMIGLPAGHLEKMETFAECMAREANEEVGVTINSNDAKLVFFGHRFEPNGEYDYVDCYFEVEKWQGEPINNEPDKSSELVWVDIENLPDDTMPYQREHLTAWQRGENYHDSQRDDD